MIPLVPQLGSSHRSETQLFEILSSRRVSVFRLKANLQAIHLYTFTYYKRMNNRRASSFLVSPEDFPERLNVKQLPVEARVQRTVSLSHPLSLSLFHNLSLAYNDGTVYVQIEERKQFVPHHLNLTCHRLCSMSFCLLFLPTFWIM